MFWGYVDVDVASLTNPMNQDLYIFNRGDPNIVQGGQIIYRATTSGTVRGIIPIINGDSHADQVIAWTNAGSGGTVVIKHEDVTVSANYRFNLPGSTDITLDNYEGAIFFYDLAALRWKVLAESSSSSGGGTTSNNGQAGLGSAYNCTNAMASTGLSVTLTTVGTYLLTAEVLGSIQTGSVGDQILARLYDTTSTLTVDRSQVYVAQNQQTSSLAVGTGTISILYTTSAVNSVVELQAQYASTIGPVVTAQIVLGTNLAFIQIS